MRQPGRQVRLVSTVLHGYAGRLIYSGQVFDAEERDVDTLIRDKKARYPKEEASIGERKVATALPPKRRYRRRDMRAEK